MKKGMVPHEPEFGLRDIMRARSERRTRNIHAEIYS
jgi:hypothetical protein